MNEFYCRTLKDPDGPIIIWAAGDINAGCAARLCAEIEPRLDEGEVVVLYCAAVTTIDTAGLRALLHAAATADQTGATFALAALSTGVRQTLELCDLCDVLTVYSTIAEAQNACQARHPRARRPAPALS